MPYQIVGIKLPVLLTLSGLSSGLLTCASMSRGQQEADLYCGVVFGFLLAMPLAISGILDSRVLTTLLKTMGLVAISTGAYYLAAMAAMEMQWNFRQIVPEAERWDMGTNEPASAIALFVGGLIGGILVFTGVIFLSRPELNMGSRARKIIPGTLLGGILGIVGWKLRSSVGVTAWNLLHAFGLTPSWELGPGELFHGTHDFSQRTRMYSLYIVWQTGIAAAIGIMLRRPLDKKESKSENLHLSNSS